MVEVSVIKTRGVIDGLSVSEAKELARDLPTETEVVGNRVKFRPTRPVLDRLVKMGCSFDASCREKWAHFYKAAARSNVDFSFKLDPFDHQRDWWSTVKDKRIFAFEWEMGLGKSKVALDIGQWQYSCGDIDAILVITLKGVHRKWVEHDVPENVAIPHTAAYWNTGRVENGMRALNDGKGLKIATINFDAVIYPKGRGFVNRFLDENRCLVIIDESHNIKTHNSRRTKEILKFSKKAVRRMILTGTPTTGSPLDVWAQYAFLDPDIIGMDFYQFKARYAVQKELPDTTCEVWRKNPKTGRSMKVEEPVKIIVGYTKLEELKSTLDPFRSRLLKDDVLNLPEKIYRRAAYDLPEQHRKAYEQLRKELFLEIGDRQMTAPMALTMLTRLRQLLAGFVMPDDADPAVTLGEPFAKTNPRIETLMQQIDQSSGKVIVWANYRYSLREIRETLRESYGDGSVGVYAGETKDAQRSRIVDEFMKGDLRFFVGNPQAGGTGINLTAARDVIYFDNNYRLDLRLQSEDRAHRIGQKFPVTYTDIEALDTIDNKIITALRDKRDIASTITGDDLRDWLS